MAEREGLFWGTIIETDKKYTVAVKKPFSITMAALDPHQSKISENVTLLLKRGDVDHVLCTLVNGSLFQQELDLSFDKGGNVELFTHGTGTVYLTGYYMDGADLGDKEEYEEESDYDKLDEDEKEEDEDPFIAQSQLMLLDLSKKLIEKNKRKSVIRMYNDKISIARPEDREWLEEDLDEMMKYNYDVALEEAQNHEKDGTFAYEYFYEKALRLKPKCKETILKVESLKEEMEISDKSRLDRITEKRERYHELVKNSKTASIDESRLYKVVQTTVAMEGNTFELDEVEQFLKTKKRFSNRSAYEHREVADSASAINFAKQTLFANHSPITLKNVLDVHQKVTETSKPDIAGKMRVDEDVIVGTHVAPPPEQVSGMMKDFIECLNSKAKQFHPVEEAARAHFDFVDIHPFVDGNGRTSRILMNIVLQRNGYPVVDIPMDRQEDYYSSLSMSDDDYYKAFIRFIAECTERTLDEYLSVHDS